MIFYKGTAAPQGCYTYMIMIIKMIEIYIAAHPYYCWRTHAHYIVKNRTARPTYVFIV